MKNLETYSANSLKLLDKDPGLFCEKYLKSLYLSDASPETKKGEEFHKLIYYYLIGFDIAKIENVLPEYNHKLWESIKNAPIVSLAKNSEKKYIEHPFLVKENDFYLTGRFDAVIEYTNKTQSLNKYKILDWKIINLPKDPQNDIQTTVYLYCASILYKTPDISLTYYSLTKNESTEIVFDSSKNYLEIIKNIIKKNPKTTKSK